MNRLAATVATPLGVGVKQSGPQYRPPRKSRYVIGYASIRNGSASPPSRVSGPTTSGVAEVAPDGRNRPCPSDEHTEDHRDDPDGDGEARVRRRD